MSGPAVRERLSTERSNQTSDGASGGWSSSASNSASRVQSRQSRQKPEPQPEWRPIDDAVVCELVFLCRLSRALSPPITAAMQLQTEWSTAPPCVPTRQRFPLPLLLSSCLCARASSPVPASPLAAVRVPSSPAVTRIRCGRWGRTRHSTRTEGGRHRVEGRSREGQDGRRRRRCSRFAPPLDGPCASVAVGACRGRGPQGSCRMFTRLHSCALLSSPPLRSTLALIQTNRALQLTGGALASTRLCASASAPAASGPRSNLHAARSNEQRTNQLTSKGPIGWVAAHRHRQRAWRPCSLWFQRKEAAAREDTRRPRRSRLRDGTTQRSRSSRSKSHNTR
jgi:hypothetical protein